MCVMKEGRKEGDVLCIVLSTCIMIALHVFTGCFSVVFVASLQLD